MELTKDRSGQRAVEKEPCAQHSFSNWVDEVAMIWDMERYKLRRTNVILPYFVYSFTRKVPGKHTKQPLFYSVSHGHPPSLEDTHI